MQKNQKKKKEKVKKNVGSYQGMVSLNQFCSKPVVGNSPKSQTKRKHSNSTFSSSIPVSQSQSTKDAVVPVAPTPLENKDVTPFYFKSTLTTLLIECYKTHSDKFKNLNFTAKAVWEMISNDMKVEMIKQNYTTFPTYKQCNNRWNTINKAYRAVVDHNRISGNNRKTCVFYEELNELNGSRPNVNPVATLCSTGSTSKKRKLEEMAIIFSF